MSVATRSAPPAPPALVTRQSWLDALRGVAALVVVFEHSLDALLPEVRGTVSPWFDFGQYGVLVFFLVSGYVIPISLERRGDVRGFWITRFFRLYPLWALAAALGVGFALAGVYTPLSDQAEREPWVAALAHLTMLQDLFQVPSVVNVFWTLSYEMAFYLLVTAMFLLGARRAGTGTSVTLAGCALVAGALVPAGLLSRSFGTGPVVVAMTVTMVAAGIAAVLGAGRPTRARGAAVLAVAALALVVLNSRVGAWQSLIILATMFGGTAIHRVERSAGGAWALWAMPLVPALSVAAAVLHGPGWGMTEAGQQAFKWGWSTAVVAAWLTFAAGLALRHRAVSPVLAWLGLTSYSLYLLHPLVLQVIRRVTGDAAQMPLTGRLLWEAVFFALVIGAAALGYRFVERPAQRLGRRLASPAPSPHAPPDVRPDPPRAERWRARHPY
ncbi:acyltransferase [Sphaerisporangium sp. TRM90804]|uniref:acyltransferase family protein n=1 Tax=Sphaerisporangium sp. TRM90804 TaxID=3031113 RepID=UPI00244807E2|nr:acyltransferase [Sphaerisporangium sp. TRM90804]MDH2425472.1 acyltransferase [Sphaerisporangium sp. TRM90804]